MKRIVCLISAIGAIALCGSTARAADLTMPRYTAPPPPPPPVYSWTGFYFGGNGGFGGDQFKYPASIGPSAAAGLPSALTSTTTLKSSGFFGGGQIGYNWQVAPAWVLGVESDFDAADIESTANATSGGTSASAGTKLDWFGTVRGRVGVLVTPSALLYGTGGWAYGHTTSSASASAFGVTANTSAGHDKSGWTAGAGLEYAFNPWLSFKTEYLYLNLGTDTITSGTVASVPYSLSEKTTVHTVKVGLNFKLGGWGQGYAHY
jgi:outer membrane immunogenic protein